MAWLAVSSCLTASSVDFMASVVFGEEVDVVFGEIDDSEVVEVDVVLDFYPLLIMGYFVSADRLVLADPLCTLNPHSSDFPLLSAIQLNIWIWMLKMIFLSFCSKVELVIFLLSSYLLDSYLLGSY